MKQDFGSAGSFQSYVAFSSVFPTSSLNGSQCVRQEQMDAHSKWMLLQQLISQIRALKKNDRRRLLLLNGKISIKYRSAEWK